MQPPPYGPPPGSPGYGPPPGAGAPGTYGQPPQGYGGPPGGGYPPVPAGPGGMQGQVTAEDKQLALIAHLSNIFFWLVGPLVLYLVKKDTSKFVAFHALQSLYLALAGIILTTITCGVGAFPILILNVIAAMKANEGQLYEYPVVGAMARKSVYGS
jgi:uncharacterized protein